MKPIYVYDGMSESEQRAYIEYARKRRNARVRAFRDMIERIAQNALGENADIELVRSMIQRRFRLDEERTFTATLKRRAKLAQDSGLTVSIFRNLPIDATPADEIAIAQAQQSGGKSCAGAEIEKKLERVNNGLELLKEGQSEQGDFLIGLGQTVNEIDRNTRHGAVGRGSDLEVSQPVAAQILTGAGLRISERQIQNWERYIRTNGAEGTQPPEGYRLTLRADFESFNAWAKQAAAGRRMKRALAERRRKEHKTNG